LARPHVRVHTRRRSETQRGEVVHHGTGCWFGARPGQDRGIERDRDGGNGKEHGGDRPNHPDAARAATRTAMNVEPVGRAGLEQGLEAGGEWIVHPAASSTDSSRRSCSWAWASVAATVPSATPVAAAISG